MKLLAKHMMESVSGAGNQDNIDNIKFINDLVLTAAIGASMTPAAPVAGAGTAVVGSLIHSTNHQIQAWKIRLVFHSRLKQIMPTDADSGSPGRHLLQVCAACHAVSGLPSLFPPPD